MPELNPIWGVHVVPGAVTAALVRRTAPGTYEILDAIAERAPEDPAAAMRAAVTLLARRGVGARGAIVALPDARGCLVTATIPPDELDLSEHEISNEMYEWTPFEPEEAELRHQCVLREGRRQERVVAAVPRADYRAFLEVLETGDVSRIGVGFSGAATWRGARAMGLVPDDGYLVATLPRVTEVYASPFGRVRRHLLALGEEDLSRDATAVDLLARDLAQLADYYRALRRNDEKAPAEPRFALCGLSAVSPPVRQRLAAVLGPRLVDGPGPAIAVTLAPTAKTPAAPTAALAGAVGAALEALRPADERLVLRHAPADLPPYRERSAIGWVAAAAAVVAAGWLAVEQATSASGTVPRRTPVLRPAEEPARPARPAPAEPAPPPSQEPHEQPAPREAPAPISPVEAEIDGPGRVRVRWGEGDGPRTLRRRFLGRDGSGPDDGARDVRKIEASAGDCIDDVPGPTGLYAWSVGGGGDARAFVEVRVDVELLGPGDEGGARFALRRSWRDGVATLAVDVAPGGRLTGTDGDLVFDSGWRLDAVRTRIESERAAVRVPRFTADGRIERGPDGAAVTGERVVERERRIFEADAVAPDGSRRQWSRKMTDG